MVNVEFGFTRLKLEPFFSGVDLILYVFAKMLAKGFGKQDFNSKFKNV